MMVRMGRMAGWQDGRIPMPWPVDNIRELIGHGCWRLVWGVFGCLDVWWVFGCLQNQIARVLPLDLVRRYVGTLVRWYVGCVQVLRPSSGLTIPVGLALAGFPLL